MSEAKYKVGDDVAFHIDGFGPGHGAVQKVTIHYTIKTPGGAVYYREEEDVTPYVRPLAVGDRVRCNSLGGGFCIKAIHNEAAWLWSDDGKYATRPLYDLERIPTEANQ